jgi:hypothetical protein
VTLQVNSQMQMFFKFVLFTLFYFPSFSQECFPFSHESFSCDKNLFSFVLADKVLEQNRYDRHVPGQHRLHEVSISSGLCRACKA